MTLSRPVTLDSTPFEVASTYVNYSGWYATGCAVHEGVALAVWCDNSQTSTTFEARAVRWVVDGDVPGVELGPRFTGPDASTYPHPDSFPVSFNEAGQVQPLGNGWAFIFFQELAARNPSFGQLVHVDEASLAITLGARIDDPLGTRYPDGWLNPVAVGDGRITLNGLYSSSTVGGSVWVTFDTTSVTPTHTITFDPTPTSAWDITDYMAWTDMGSYWIGYMIVDTPGPSASTDLMQVHTFPDVGGRPDPTVAPTVRYSETRGSGWDFDSVSSVAMDGGLVYVMENDYAYNGQGYAVWLWVLDTSTWTFTRILSPGSAYQSFQGGLASYTNMSKIDGLRVAVSWATMISSSPDSGGYVALFDGTALQFAQNIYPWNGSEFSNPLLSFYNWESFHVGSGQMITIAITDDDSATVTTPPEYVAPKAIASLLPIEESIDAGPLRSWGKFARRKNS